MNYLFWNKRIRKLHWKESRLIHRKLWENFKWSWLIRRISRDNIPNASSNNFLLAHVDRRRREKNLVHEYSEYIVRRVHAITLQSKSSKSVVSSFSTRFYALKIAHQGKFNSRVMSARRRPLFLPALLLRSNLKKARSLDHVNNAPDDIRIKE